MTPIADDFAAIRARLAELRGETRCVAVASHTLSDKARVTLSMLQRHGFLIVSEFYATERR